MALRRMKHGKAFGIDLVMRILHGSLHLKSQSCSLYTTDTVSLLGATSTRLTLHVHASTRGRSEEIRKLEHRKV